ncbi:MAG: YdjY domain-containing protein [Gemmataceae bacterium]|nr:YdjY domain-containing protein [Gemmataceae bacterium]MDW8266318.1 YdjY domain-containing protein [Gemmataceae bacterium]
MRRLVALLAVLAVPVTLVSADPPGLRVEREQRRVVIDAKIAPRKLDDPKFEGKIYPIEVVACWPFPKGQKAHETVVTIDVRPSEVHQALESLGLKPGMPVMGESKEPPQGPEVLIYLEVPGPDGQPKRLSMDRVLIDPRTNKPLPKSVQWRFTGSALKQPDPNKPEKVYGADTTGTLIAIFPVTNDTVIQTNLTLKEEKYIKLETNAQLLPPVGTPVKLVIEVPKK